MQLVNISFRTLLIYRFLFYLLKKYACLFCRVSQSLDFSFIFVVAFNMLLCPLYSLIKLKFNFLAFVSGVAFFHQETSNGCLVVSPACFPSFFMSFFPFHISSSWFLAGEPEVGCMEWGTASSWVIVSPYPLASCLCCQHGFLFLWGHHCAAKSLPRDGWADMLRKLWRITFHSLCSSILRSAKFEPCLTF